MAGRTELSEPEQAGGATPKLRSRSGGAAVALEDLDRRLLNLMQGRFPIAPRPYREVARLAETDGFGEREAIERTARLLQQRIIRQVTPIFDTRALGLLLDAGGGEGRSRPTPTGPPA